MAGNDDRRESDLLPRLVLTAIAIVLVAFVVGVWHLVGHYPWREMDADEASKFGDSFGYVNALFAGLAFAGVIYAILLQSKELRLQREELEYTRDELHRSANAQEQTQRALYMSLPEVAERRKLRQVGRSVRAPGGQGHLVRRTVSGILEKGNARP
jgi:hypothetical protein